MAGQQGSFIFLFFFGTLISSAYANSHNFVATSEFRPRQQRPREGTEAPGHNPTSPIS